jgi:nucleotide-binding universal stress UspA family protein
MTWNIVLPFDGIKSSIYSVRYALDFAKILDANLYVLHIVNQKAYQSAKKVLGKNESETKKYCLNRIEGIFEEVKNEATKKGFNKCFFEVKFSEHIEEGIANFAKEKKADLCVIQPSPYAQVELVGDLAMKITKKLNTPVLFIKTKKMLRANPIFFVPIDENVKNLVSAKSAIEIAEKFKAEIVFYHTTWVRKEVISCDPIDHCLEEVKENIRMVEKLASNKKIKFKTIIKKDDSISGGIIRSAVENEADIIFMNESSSLIGGQPTLVLKNSMYPMILTKK